MSENTPSEFAALFQKIQLCKLEISVWSGKIKMPVSQLNPDVDQQSYDARKYLVAKESLDHINHIASKARGYVDRESFSFLGGSPAVPLGKIPQMADDLQVMAHEFDAEKERFAQNYDGLIESQALRLRENFNRAEYPVNIRSKFSFRWLFFSMAPPNGNTSSLLSPDIIRAEQGKLRDVIADFRETAITELRSQFAKILSHAIEILKDPDKRIHSSTIENFNKFFDTFSLMNIHKDQEMEHLIDEMRGWITSADPDTLKSNDSFRQEIAGKLEQVDQQLDTFFYNRPSRAIIA